MKSSAKPKGLTWYNPLIVLLLGSYDQSTRNLLEQLKQKIAEHYGSENTYAFLLDDLEIFDLREIAAYILVELKHNKAHAYIFEYGGAPKEEFTVKYAEREELQGLIAKHLQEKLIEPPEHPIPLRKLSILEKLSTLIERAALIFIIRDKEETRGGELVELTYAALAGHGNKICFLKRENIKLSTMVLELLDYANINLRTYNNQQKLIQQALRYLHYRITELKEKHQELF